MAISIARRMWLIIEPIHAVTYFAPESSSAWEAAGWRGFWRGYFATRAAPFGPVGPEVVTATFFNFAPGMVARALPGVWEMASPADAIDARASGAAASLRRILGDEIGDASARQATDAIEAAMAACSPAGRPLYAANAGLSSRPDPVEALWQALTTAREHRGDGHNAALVSRGLDGCQAHVLASAVGAAEAGRDVRQPTRGWTDDDWEHATSALEAAGLLDADGAATDAGRALHADVEATTDESAMAPWRHLGADATAALAAQLAPWAARVVRSGVIPFPNPMGLPAPPEL